MHRMSIILSSGTFQLETIIFAVISKTDLTSRSLGSSWISVGYHLYLQRESPLWNKNMNNDLRWPLVQNPPFSNGINTIYIVCTMSCSFWSNGLPIYAYKLNFLWFTFCGSEKKSTYSVQYSIFLVSNSEKKLVFPCN